MDAEALRAKFAQLMDPLVRRLWWVNPNMLTSGNLLVAVAAGASLAHADTYPALYLVTVLSALVYGLVDGLDGLIARAHRRVSRWGDFLDHSIDRLALLIGLGGLLWNAHAANIPVLLLMILTLYHGYLGTQLETSAGRRTYAGIGIGELLVIGCVGSLIAYTVQVTGLPFFYTVPGVDRPLSLLDVFILGGSAVAAAAIVQRFHLAWRLLRAPRPQPKPQPVPDPTSVGDAVPGEAGGTP